MIISGEKMYSKPATEPADIIVLHDTDSKDLNTFVKKGIVGCKLKTGCYSVTYTVDTDGSVRQHHDLKRRGIHAGKHVNPRSWGIEVQSQFNPSRGVPVGNQRLVEADWFPGGLAIMPSQEQLENTFKLVRGLVRQSKVPKKFPALRAQIYPWRPVFDGEKNLEPGIYAHAHLTTQRGDGHYPTVYTYFRFGGYSPREAYRLTEKAGMDAVAGVSLLPPPKTYMQALNTFWEVFMDSITGAV